MKIFLPKVNARLLYVAELLCKLYDGQLLAPSDLAEHLRQYPPTPAPAGPRPADEAPLRP